MRTPPKEDRMSLNDVVEHVMKATGRTRRQARQAVLQKLKSGELHAWATFKGEEHLDPELLPPDYFRNVPSEH